MTNEFELVDSRISIDHELDIRKLISSYEILNGYTIIPCSPATGILFISKDNPGFISGHVRMRGKNEGRYPFHYLEMIDNIFGYEANTIEVCSRSSGKVSSLQPVQRLKTVRTRLTYEELFIKYLS